MVERGEMTLRFILVRSALVWARVRAAGGLEDTTSLPPLPPTTRLPEPEDMTNERTPNKLREAQNCRTTPLKGHWLPVLLENEDWCTKLLIRCAGAVAGCQGVEINCLVSVLMSRSWGADTYCDDVRVLLAGLEVTTCCETTRETSRPYSLDFNTEN